MGGRVQRRKLFVRKNITQERTNQESIPLRYFPECHVPVLYVSSSMH